MIKSQIEVLYLNDNEIETMDFIEKSELPRLGNLSLISNKIKKLSIVTNLSKLHTLVLDTNPIEDYDDFFMKSKMPV